MELVRVHGVVGMHPWLQEQGVPLQEEEEKLHVLLLVS
jgi:hypothetical protein